MYQGLLLLEIISWIVNMFYFHFMGELIQFEMSIKIPTSLLVGIHIFNPFA